MADALRTYRDVVLLRIAVRRRLRARVLREWDLHAALGACSSEQSEANAKLLMRIDRASTSAELLELERLTRQP